jgi:hypothetical protein
MRLARGGGTVTTSRRFRGGDELDVWSWSWAIGMHVDRDAIVALSELRSSFGSRKICKRIDGISAHSRSHSELGDMLGVSEETTPGKLRVTRTSAGENRRKLISSPSN